MCIVGIFAENNVKKNTMQEGIIKPYALSKKKIYTNEYVTALREREEKNKSSKVFIAQEGPQEDDLHSSVDILITGGNRGGGKANPYSTPIATPNGFVKMGDLEVGDCLCTPYDGIQKVSQIFEQGEQTIYTFHFNDGTQLQCMDNHRFWARLGIDSAFKEYSAREILGQYKIDSKFPNSLRSGKTDYFEIPLPAEVEMNENRTEVDLPIHPLLLGYICGSGFTEFPRGGVDLGGDMTISRKVAGAGYRVLKRHGKYVLKGLSDEARRQITKKRGKQLARIPKEYMTASISARWEFLRGVFFQNGFSKRKHPHLVLPNKPLIEDIATLARSLGIWAKIYEVVDEPEHIGWWGIVFICPDDAEIYCKVCYQKRAHVNGEKPKSPNSPNVITKQIMWVQKMKVKQPCRCITVTGKDHLYLSDAYTVNHNTFTLLMEPMYDIHNSNFNGIILRKNKDDFNNIIRDSRRLYSKFGRYNKSKDDMAWYFYSGADLNFGIYDMPYDDFDDKYRGQQFAYIGIDELPQMSFKMFKFLLTSNRNGSGIKSRILGTCNPDPLSWLRVFIDWFIGKDGLPIPERNGVIRYCYMKGDSVDDTVWGNTPEEVYEQCKDEIDSRWDESFEELGYDKKSFFVKSMTFIKADLKYNKKLLKSDPGYLAGLHNQTEEIKARELDGNWNFMEMGDDMIKMSHMEKCFRNDQMLGDHIHRATCDVAFTGGDNCVLWHWIGWHLADIFVCKLDSMSTCQAVESKLTEWGVTEKNFCYDLNGLGQTFKGYFKHAVPFNNVEAVQAKYKNIYDNVKSQCAYMFAKKLQQAEISFEPTLLEQKFSGKGYDGKQLKDVLQVERKCIRQDISKLDKGWCLIKKEQMKRLVKHSPDFFEALIMRMYFEINRQSVKIPSWVINF